MYQIKQKGRKDMKTTSDIRTRLRSGIIEFSYIKKDGTVRKSHGTLMMDIISSNTVFKGDTSRNTEGYINYFDTDVMAWRKFREDCLLCEGEG